MRHLSSLVVGFLLAMLSVGCSSSAPTAEELGLGSAEEEYAKSIRDELQGLKESLAEEGAGSLASSLEGTLENFEDYADSPVGDKLATYEQIYKGLEELSTGSPSANEAKAKIDALLKLAEGLPGASGE